MVAPAGRRLDAASRRETILRAALPEFAATGYEGTRVSDVAAKVGVTEPVVFQNFGTKAGLFSAVLERAAAETAGHLALLAARAPTALEAVRHLLDHAHQDRLHEPGGIGTIFLEAAGHREPAIRKAAHRAHRQTLEALAGLVRRGQQDGSIRSDLDAAALSGLLLSQIHSRQIRRALVDTSPAVERDVLEALLGVLRPRRSAAR